MASGMSVAETDRLVYDLWRIKQTTKKNIAWQSPESAAAGSG